MKRSRAFRNRAKSRIKEQYKPKSENNSRGISEIIVALASMVGGIAAAISAFLSYRQIVLIDEQKLTPFQVAEYTEELQQFKNIDAAISEYISNGLAIKYSIKEIVGLNGSPELQKSMYKILRNNIKERLGESDKLRRTLSDNSSFWGSESLSLIAGSIRATASDDKSGYCVRFSPDEHIVKCIENRTTIDSSLRQRLMSSLKRDMDEGRSR